MVSNVAKLALMRIFEGFVLEKVKAQIKLDHYQDDYEQLRPPTETGNKYQPALYS